MSLVDIALLMRRHIAAVMVVLVLATVVGYELKHAKPIYSDSVTLAFRTPANPFSVGPTLLVTADLMARSMMSPESEQLVRQAGGTAGYQVNLVNLYNVEYPDYSVPYVTVSVTARNPADAEQTFSAVMRVLTDELRTRQMGDGIAPANQIGTRVLSGTPGAVPLTGYPKRTFAALAILTIIAVFLIAAFLDKRPLRLGGFRGLDRLRRRLSPQRGSASPAPTRLSSVDRTGSGNGYRLS